MVSLSSEQLKHLDYIQDAVGRHVTHAFAVKGWSLTVTGVVVAYAAGHLDPGLALVALLPPLAFAWLDLYYLRQAQLYEELYRDVIQVVIPPCAPSIWIWRDTTILMRTLDVRIATS